MDRKRSEVWKFFEIINGRRVKCNFCEQECSSVISNMKKHLVTKHPTANEILVKIEDETLSLDNEDGSSDVLANKNTETSAEVEIENDSENQNLAESISRKRSLIWNFFDVISDKKAKCKFCRREQSSVISNMKKHLRVNHPTVNDVKNATLQLTNDPAIIATEEPENESSDNEKPTYNNSGKRSFVWEFFDQIDDRRALCRLCNKEQSCVTSNMKLHLEKKHSGEQIHVDGTLETKPFDERFNEDDSNDSFNYPEELPILSTCSKKPKQKVAKTDVYIKKAHDSDKSKLVVYKQQKMERRQSGNQNLMDRKRSSVWQYFEIISANRAICNICGKEQSSVISNVKKHLIAIHPAAFQEMVKGCKPRKAGILNMVKRRPLTPVRSTSLILPKKRRHSKRISYAESDLNDDSSEEAKPSASKYQTRNNKSLDKNKYNRSSSVEVEESSIQLSPTQQISKKMAEKADQILLKLIIKHFQDYNIVQDSEIIKFIRTINKWYKLPSKDTIGNSLIPDLHAKCMFQTKLKIKSCKKYCTTIDCWSNMHATNFITVTVHYINEEFVLNSILLDCSVIQKQDTPANLAQELRSVLTNWDLNEEDVILAVLDNSISNIKSVLTEELKWDAHDCFVNVINSIAKDSFSNEWIQNIIDKVKDLIHYFKGCEFSTENLAEFQKQRDDATTPLKLTKDLPRCWYSTFRMLQRFLDLEDAIKHSLNMVEKELQTLSILEWEVVGQLVNCVKPLDHVMTMIKKETDYCLASLVVPLINGLKNVYNNLSIQDLHNPVRDVIKNIVQSISENFDGIEIVEPFSLATFLDPRFKNKAFSNQIIGDQVRDKVVNILNAEETCSFQNKRPSQMDENDPQSEFWSFFQDSTNNQSSNSQTSRIIIEVQRYLEDGVVSRLENPLFWWSKNHVRYPRLANLARERLCCVASSVPCCRYYSKKGQTAIENRSRVNSVYKWISVLKTRLALTMIVFRSYLLEFHPVPNWNV